MFRVTNELHLRILRELVEKSFHPWWEILSSRFLRSSYCCCSVTKSCPTLCDLMDCSTPGFPVRYLPDFAQTHVYWFSDAIQPSHFLLPPSPLTLNLPASESFPMSLLFASGGQNIRALALVLPVNIQGWFPSGLSGLISSLSKGLSRVFFSTTIRKHQFFGAQPSLWSNSHIHI